MIDRNVELLLKVDILSTTDGFFLSLKGRVIMEMDRNTLRDIWSDPKDMQETSHDVSPCTQTCNHHSFLHQAMEFLGNLT